MNCGKSALMVMIVGIVSFGNFCRAQQLISNENFKLGFTDEGLSSLKRTNDVYDTDYIIQNSAVGDISIAYKSAGDSGYSRLHSAKLISAEANQVRYNIGLPLVPFLSTVRPSASVGRRTASALNDAPRSRIRAVGPAVFSRSILKRAPGRGSGTISRNR